MYASPTVLIFSRPKRSDRASSIENSPLSQAAVSSGDTAAVRDVKSAMSANSTVASGNRSAIIEGFRLRRSAIGLGRMFSSRLSDRACSRPSASSARWRSIAKYRSRKNATPDTAPMFITKLATMSQVGMAGAFGDSSGSMSPETSVTPRYAPNHVPACSSPPMRITPSGERNAQSITPLELTNPPSDHCRTKGRRSIIVSWLARRTRTSLVRKRWMRPTTERI